MMGSRRFVRLVVVLLVVLAFASGGGLFVSAQSSENSLLDCDKTETVPGDRVNCRIYVRDQQMDPTVGGRAADFAVRVTVDRDDAGVTVTPVTPTDDAMVFAFSVSSRLGTNLRIDVMLAATGGPLRGSGVAVVVLTSPVQIGAITCNATVLSLRATVKCAAPLQGPDNRPAVATSRDVLFTEDHSEGQFTFVSGSRSVVFTYTAPNFLSSTFGVFVLRATLMSAASNGQAISLPLSFPLLAPSPKSIVKCMTQGTCSVLAFDDFGPVTFNATQFSVSFDRSTVPTVPGAGNGAASSVPFSINFNSGMAYKWVDLPFANAKTLAYDAVVPNEVFLCRVSVGTWPSPSAVVPSNIVGSPVIVTIGVPPVAGDVQFYRCLSSFVTSGLSTTCYLVVADSATADPKFLSIQAASGLVSEARYYNATGVVGADPFLLTRRVITFDYIAPLGVKRRTEDSIFVTINGVSVGRTPWRMVMFPQTQDTSGAKAVDRKGSVIVVGSLFFGATYAVGIWAWLRRQRRKRLVNEARRVKFLQERAQEAMEKQQEMVEIARSNVVMRRLESTERMKTPQEGWIVPPARELDSDEEAEVSTARAATDDAH